MKKSIIALAVAAAVAAPAAFADAVLSGVVEFQAKEVSSKDAAKDAKFRFSSGDVRINVAADHQLDNGLVAYANYRVDADGKSGTTLTSDSVYVGLKGDFGNLRVGEVQVPVAMGQLANDIHGIDSAINEGISYTTNDLSGFKAQVAFSPSGNDSSSAGKGTEKDATVGLGLSYSANGFTVGYGYDKRDNKDINAVGAKYDAGQWFVAAHTAKVESSMSGETSATAVSDKRLWAVQAGYNVTDDLSVALTHSDVKDLENVTRIDVDYALGAKAGLNFRVQTADADSAAVEKVNMYRVLYSVKF